MSEFLEDFLLLVVIPVISVLLILSFSEGVSIESEVVSIEYQHNVTEPTDYSDINVSNECSSNLEVYTLDECIFNSDKQEYWCLSR